MADVEKLELDDDYDYDGYNDTYYSTIDHWDIGQFDNKEYDDVNLVSQVDDETDSQANRYVTHIQDGYTEEQQLPEYYDENLMSFDDTAPQEQIVENVDISRVAETFSAPVAEPPMVVHVSLQCEVYMHMMPRASGENSVAE